MTLPIPSHQTPPVRRSTATLGASNDHPAAIGCSPPTSSGPGQPPITAPAATPTNNPYIVAAPPPPQDWREEALCAQSEPDIWYPPQGYDGTQTTRIAKRICGQCPVQQPCLDTALDHNEIHGIWGGLTHNERQEIRRHRRRRPMTRNRT